ncbi:hypothetical protein [Spiroplasma poulsonii]|nr:hypothetical protein [Spiroplasma poulsonii]
MIFNTSNNFIKKGGYLKMQDFTKINNKKRITSYQHLNKKIWFEF